MGERCAPVAMAFLNRITVRNAMTATPTMVMGAMPFVRSKQAGSVQFQGSHAYPVAPMLVMPDLQATVVMALSKPERSVTAVMERFQFQEAVRGQTTTTRMAIVRQDARGGPAAVIT